MDGLNLSGINLSVTSSSLLARAGSILSSLNVSRCLLTRFQCDDLIDQISQKNNRAKRELTLDKLDLSSVNPFKLASVTYNVRVISLRDTRLTENQIFRIFKENLRSSHENNSIVQATFASLMNVSKIDAESFSLFFCQIQDINLSCCSLTTEQLHSLMSCRMHKIKSLDISFNDLSSINCSLLKSFALTLETFSLAHSKLTREKLMELFEAIGQNVSS